MSAYGLSPPADASSQTEATYACKMCHGNSGVIELLVGAPTARCKHFAEVCLDCINRVILKALKSSQPILCPSNDCSERLSRRDVQRWLTPPELDRDNARPPPLQSSLRTDSRDLHSLEPRRTVREAQADRVGHEGLTSGRWEEHQRNLPQQQEPVRHESFQRGGRACSGPDYGRQQIQNVEGYRPRFCPDCGTPQRTVSMDCYEHRAYCRYSGSNAARPGIVLDGSLANADHMQTPTLLPAFVNLGKPWVQQNSNRSDTTNLITGFPFEDAGRDFGNMSTWARAVGDPPNLIQYRERSRDSTWAYDLPPPVVPLSRQPSSRLHAEPSSSLSQTGAAPRESQKRQISVESVHRDRIPSWPGLGHSPTGRAETPEGSGAFNRHMGSPGSTMDWETSL